MSLCTSTVVRAALPELWSCSLATAKVAFGDHLANDGEITSNQYFMEEILLIDCLYIIYRYSFLPVTKLLGKNLKILLINIHIIISFLICVSINPIHFIC